MDISVAFMMFTCKYSYLAYSYTDGEIEKLPGLLEYLGFIYFYPAAVIGPTYNFVTYQQFIHLKGQYVCWVIQRVGEQSSLGCIDYGRIWK